MNILIVPVSRIAFTKIRNLRNFDAIFTTILIVTISRIAFTKNRNLRSSGNFEECTVQPVLWGNVYMCYNHVHLDNLSDISAY